MRFDAQLEAETRFVEAAGLRFAYRRFGPRTGTPLVLCQRFNSSMDDWDSTLLEQLSKERDVVVFDNAGVGASSGVVPNSIGGMAYYLVQFVEAMGFAEVDLLGLAMGGFVALTVAMDWPAVVCRLVLASSGAGGGDGMVLPEMNSSPQYAQVELELEELLNGIFHGLPGRRHDVAAALSLEGFQAQVAAITAWSIGLDCAARRLDEIKHPALVANGSHDSIVPTSNTMLMAQKLPNAKLVLYPYTGHGFLLLQAEAFALQVLEFLR